MSVKPYFSGITNGAVGAIKISEPHPEGGMLFGVTFPEQLGDYLRNVGVIAVSGFAARWSGWSQVRTTVGTKKLVFMFKVNAGDICRPFQKGEDVNLELMLQRKQMSENQAVKHIGDGHLNEGIVHGTGIVIGSKPMDNGGKTIQLLVESKLADKVQVGYLFGVDGVSMTLRAKESAEDSAMPIKGLQKLTVEAWPDAGMKTTLARLKQDDEVNIGLAVVARQYAPNP